VGVYISRVEENSVAEHVGLRPGDSILEVNGMPFGGVSHDEALKVRLIFFYPLPHQVHPSHEGLRLLMQFTPLFIALFACTVCFLASLFDANVSIQIYIWNNDVCLQ
jgi:PDZ domain